MSEISRSPAPAPLPDVVSQTQTVLSGALAWAGMDGIELSLPWVDADGERHRLAARGSAFVNLARAEDRGIHMSRLYRALDTWLLRADLTAAGLRLLLAEFLQTHPAISDRARIELRFELPLRRASLRSGLAGWRLYPVRIAATLEPAGFRCESRIDIVYSSTCPGSAALSRQLVQHSFDATFPLALPARDELRTWLGTPQAICATPHAQRSIASVRVHWGATASDLMPDRLVDLLEGALGTPVQAAVRREDEQEFARLNGQHPMYCEDAARRLRTALESCAEIEDYWIRAAHIESLHPHDAVAIAVRGRAGGYAPDTE